MNNVVGNFKFHSHHGINIKLTSGNTVATRFTSFKDGLIFSSRPLAPGEIFLVEITGTDNRKWSGGIRMGLTHMTPDSEFKLPPYAAPDLWQMGRSWTCHVSDTPFFEDKQKVEEQQAAMKSAQSKSLSDPDRKDTDKNDYEYLVTSKGAVKRTQFVSETFLRDRDPFGNSQKRVGSRIGVFYQPMTESTAEWTLIINGQELHYGHMVMPYKPDPVWAIVDVYGQTSQVEAVKFDGKRNYLVVVHMSYAIHGYGFDILDSLMEFCRSAIRKSVSLDKIDELPTSWTLKNFLRQK